MAKKVEIAPTPGLSHDVIRRLEDAFGLGCTDAEACCFAGITMGEFMAHLKDNPAFKDRREVLKQRPQLLARQTVFKALKDDPQIALEYLDRVAKAGL